MNNILETISKTEDLWYFAHPYTGSGPNKILIQEANYRLCVYRTVKLIESGFKIFSPIVHSHPIENASPSILSLPEQDRHKLMMILDFTIIDKTHFKGIILAPGWSNSRGCCMEFETFKALRKEILLYSSITNEG